MVDDIINELEDKMVKAAEALRHNLSTIRTGRASTALVEYMPIEVYNSTMPLNQLAGISIPEPRLIAIQPYDPSTIRAIERSIQHSDLGINPSNDGKLIRLALPTLTEERRRELVKVVRTRVEEIKVSIRNQRRDAIDHLRKLQREKLISEDDERRAHDRIQVITDKHSKELDHIGADKEAEVMEV